MWLRSIVVRLALVAGGLLMSLLLLEGILQLGAAVVSLTGRETPGGWATGNTRILCLGDSNTYGLWIERHEAWPQQLESLWNQAPGATPIEVLNLGFPGTNSSRLRRDFPRMLETFRPDLSIVMVGANDFWTRRVPIAPIRGPSDTWSPGRWLRHSRVARLAWMLRDRLSARELEVRFEPVGEVPGQGRAGTARFGDAEFELGWERAAPGALFRAGAALDANLRALALQAQASGSRLLFMTYPSRTQEAYAEANRFIRSAARATGTELLELTEVFRPVCPEHDCPGYLFPDHHPAASGYRLIAEALAAKLGGTL